MPIEPTPGRIVWYFDAMPGGINRPDAMEAHMRTTQPMAAVIAFVHPCGPGGWRINISRLSRDGIAIPMTDVPLVQNEMDRPLHGGWCEWMPYQKGQAAKTEALEAKVSGGAVEPVAFLKTHRD